MARREVEGDTYKIPKWQFITITYTEEGGFDSGEIVMSDNTFINPNFTLMTIEGIINLLKDGLEGRNKELNYKKPPEKPSEMSIKLSYVVNEGKHDRIGIVRSTFPCDAQAIMILNLAYQLITEEVAKAQTKLVLPAGSGNIPPIGGKA